MSTTPDPGKRQPVQIAAPVIPGYRIVGKLGQGGMGVVYKAIQNSMNRAVAIKVLHPNQATSEDSIGRFQREIQVLAQLSHPNIVVAFDTGRTGNSLYYVMEYVPGKTALKLIEGGPVAEPKVIDLGIQVAKALSHAHKHNLVHRDIKPENIIVTEEGVAKLLDLGIARSLEEKADHTITSQGMMVGTPAYISPEQALGEKADIRSDLYSLGITLYQLSTGDVPFHADTTGNLMRAHITRPPDPPIKRNPALSPGFSQIILKALEKDPRHRFQTPQDMIAALERLQLQNATRAESNRKRFSRMPGVPERESAWSGMQKALVVLVVVIAALVGTFYAVKMLKKPAPAPTPPPIVEKPKPPPPPEPEKPKPPEPEKPKPQVKDMRTTILELWGRLAPAIKLRSQDAETQDLLSSWGGILRSAHEEDPALAKEFLEKSRADVKLVLDEMAVEEIRSLGKDKSRWASSRARATELHRAVQYVRWILPRARQIVPQDEKVLDECNATLSHVLGFKGTFRLQINVHPSDSRLWGMSAGTHVLVKEGTPTPPLMAGDLWMPLGLNDVEIGDWVLQFKQGNTVREVRLESAKIKPGGRVQVWGPMNELRVKYD
jgi:hypothetical protein